MAGGACIDSGLTASRYSGRQQSSTISPERGEKRRVAIAGVLAMNPQVLMLDEPTTYLDPPGQRDLVSILRALPQAKILVTHDVRFAQALARAPYFSTREGGGIGPVAEVVEKFNWKMS